MLSKTNRLAKKKDFELVFKKGQSFKNAFLLCKVLKNNNLESRFGFVVSKKVSLKAVVRNKVKRRLSKAVFDDLRKIKKPADVVMVALPGIEKWQFSDIKKAVNGSLTKLGLI